MLSKVVQYTQTYYNIDLKRNFWKHGSNLIQVSSYIASFTKNTTKPLTRLITQNKILANPYKQVLLITHLLTCSITLLYNIWGVQVLS